MTFNSPAPADFNPNPETNLDIKRIILIETRNDYQDVPSRSFSLNLTNSNYEKLSSLTHTLGHGYPNRISSSDIATAVPGIIGINAAINSLTGDYDIPYGWRTTRFRFLIEVEYSMGMFHNVEYILGYTEHGETSLSGAVDENMTFYINSILTATKTVNNVYGNGTTTIRPQEFNNIIGNTIDSYGTQNVIDNKNKLIRPSDIVNDLLIKTKYDTFDNYNFSNTPSSSFGYVSSKVNNNPVGYFTKIMNGCIDAANNTNQGFNNYVDTLTSASNMVNDGIFTNSQFIKMLNSKRNHSYIFGDSANMFTLNDLLLLDPTISNRVLLIKRGNTNIIFPEAVTILDDSSAASTVQPTHSSLISTMLANMLPSIMLDCFITNVSFHVTNKTMGEVPVATVTNCNSFIADISNPTIISRFANIIEVSVFPMLSLGMRIIELNVEADILGDISVFISVDNEPPILYRFPVFADSVYTPMITDETQSKFLIEDFGTAIDAAIDCQINDI